MSPSRRNSSSAGRILPAILFAVLPLVTSGCSLTPVSLGTFTTAFDNWIPSGGRKIADDEPRFYVELRPSIGAKVRKVIPLDRDMVLQDAVDLSRATSRFANMNLYIYRADDSGKRVKFGADFDIVKRRVKYESDYAIHPGDTVVIEENTTNPLSETLDRVTGSKSRTRR